jgi:hypothetical protein
MLPNHFRTPVLGALCALGAAVAPVLAQSPFARALPQETVLYFSMPDIRVSLEEMKEMPVGKMWREPEVQDFFADALQMANQYWDMGMAQAKEAFEQGQLPFDPDELVKMRMTSMSFALTRMELQMLEGMREPLPKFGIVAHMDFGDSAPIWKKVVETGMQMMLAEVGDDVEAGEREVAGTKVMTLRPTDAPEGFAMGLNMAWIGNGVLISTLGSDLDMMVGNLTSGAAALTAAPSWKNAVGRLDVQGAEAEFYMRPGAFIDFMMNTLQLAADEGQLPPEVDVAGIGRAIDALGLNGIQGIGSTSTYVDGRSVSSSFVAAPKALRKGLFADTTGALDRKFLRWIPKDSVGFAAGRFDMGKIYTALTDAVRAYDADMAEMVMGQLAQMEEQFGMSLQKDLFGAFGDEYVYWSMPMAAFGTAPEMAILLKVNDEERLLNTLNLVAAMSEGAFAIDKVERRGITVYQVRVEMDMGADMGGMNPLANFVPTFGFKDGYMVMAFSTGDVKRAFTRMEREDDPTGDIRTNPEFAPSLAEIPMAADSLSFTDWKASFESSYQLVTGLLAFVPLGEEIPFDLALMPEAQTLTQHLFGSVSWSITTDEGMVTRSISPFGPEVLVPLFAGVGAGLAMAGAWSGEFR